MHRRGMRTLALATVMLAALAAPAFAAGTQIRVGGSASPAGPVSVGFTDDGVLGLDTNYGYPISCYSATGDGDITPGAQVANGNKIGQISGLSSGDCTATDLNLPLVVEMSSGDLIVADDSVAAGDAVPVSIEGATFYFHSTGSPAYACEFSAEGSVDAVLEPGSSSVDGQLALTPVTVGDDSTYKLEITAMDGDGNDTYSSCGGEIVTGDLAGPTVGLLSINTFGKGAVNHG